MPECIVCKTDYTPGKPCSRCGTDNRPWEEWQREHRGLNGWITFLLPGWYLPVLLIALTFLVGITAAWELWRARGVSWPWASPSLGILTLACIIILVAVYESRYRIREQHLLSRIQQDPTGLLSARSQIMIVPLAVIVAILAWTAMILAWPAPTAPEMNCLNYLLTTILSHGLLNTAVLNAAIEVTTQGGPLSVAALGYGSLMPALVYSSSLWLALAHANRMNRRVPLPIFLHTAHLAKVVRAEAEQECSNLGPGLIWEGMERTDDGGIKLMARYRHDRKVLEDLAGKKTDLPLHTKCEVLADPWGRIRSIKPKNELQV